MRVLSLLTVLCLLLVVLLMDGCATLERHPMLTALGTAVIAGSIVASSQNHHPQASVMPFEPAAPMVIK